MKATLLWRRRLILGMSIEDAQSKFDSLESRVALRLAHERHNQGLYHELALAQRRRNRLPPERKCHLVRHTKPSVKGFQAYIKSSPDDYVVREIWREEENEEKTSANATLSTNDDSRIVPLVTSVADRDDNANYVDSNENNRTSHETHAVLEKGVDTAVTRSINSATATLAVTKTATQHLSPSHVGRHVAEEFKTYERHRAAVLSELSRAADTLGVDALRQLRERKESSTLLAVRQSPIVDRLVENVKKAKDKGYTSLSSSSHLLEPLLLSINLCGKKDKCILEAFHSPLICLPAEEHHISFSLWIAGNLMEHMELGTEFPYHIAKHAETEHEHDGKKKVDESGAVMLQPSHYLPRANIELYFSPELYQLRQTLGIDGVVALRRFIGRAMRRQHNPLPTTPSIFLNIEQSQQELFGFCSGESTQIPWHHIIKTKLSSVTGTILDISSEEVLTPSAIREAINLVWRIWGHIVKDLHIHGDLDYLYVSVWPQVEGEELKKLGSSFSDDNNSGCVLGNSHEQRKIREKRQQKEESTLSVFNMSDMVDKPMGGESPIWKRSKTRESYAKNVFFSADFVVIECVLEKKALSHRFVLEDIVESLTELQKEAMEIQRLAVVHGSKEENSKLQQDGSGDGDELRPVIYMPKVVVSHAGVIDAAAHSFQRIRIRGSCLAHVEALAHALNTGDHFTDRKGLTLIGYKGEFTNSETLLLQPNLSFSVTHSVGNTNTAGHQLLGHRVPSGYRVQRTANGRFYRHQTLQPLQNMIVDKEEREFWNAHYYRLSDIRLVFHDRVCALDIENPSEWSSLQKERVQMLINHRKHSGDKRHKLDENMGEASMEEDAAVTSSRATRNKKSQKKNNKNKRSVVNSLEKVVSSIAPEKLFEFLCVEMEMESASYDFRLGDNDGYAYNVKLRRIPENHLHLVRPAMQSLEEKGFINYFGPQRFASYTKNNMHPGLHLLKGEFRAAANIIVQQFHMDADIAAEKRRSGASFPKIYHSKGVGFSLPDLYKLNNRGRRSIAEHGTALQSILNSALQAVSLIGDDNEKSSFIDLCEEAFLRVVGPNACAMLVHEFLAFVWNDIVNQRLQRYGTFAVLPGDLVRKNPLASPHSTEYGNVVYASKSSIDKGKHTFSDVLLPLPGVGVELPENHTRDLYIVTLQRMGILFNPETKQWDIFRPRRSFNGDGLTQDVGVEGSSCDRFSSSFELIDEELCGSTRFMESFELYDKYIDEKGHKEGESQCRGTRAVDTPISSASLVSGDASHLRSDIRHGGTLSGNPLGVNIFGSYRHVLINPAPTLTWKLQLGSSGDPRQRWALGVQQAFAQNICSVTSSTENSTNTSAQEQQQLLIGNHTSSSVIQQQLWGRRRRAAPPAPYWLPKKSDASLELSFELPSNVYPSMLLRELTKSDVNSPESVDLDKPLLDNRAKSWNDLSTDQQSTYKRHLARKRQKLFTVSPRAIKLALLHQHIFRSSGMRYSLLPSMRGYNDVSK